jgi:hypothetical protein
MVKYLLRINYNLSSQTTSHFWMTPQITKAWILAPKLPTPLKMATPLGLPIILDEKHTTCRARDLTGHKLPKMPL